MKRFSKLIPYMTLVAGFVGALLRLWLHSTRGDDGFVARGHISIILLLVLTTGVLAALLLACRYFRQANKYDYNFPASAAGGIGSALGALGIAAVSVTELVTAGSTVELVMALTGLLAVAALAFLSYGRWKGHQLSVVFHSVICVYLMLRLFCMYRVWCADPQLEDYTFELLALACGMIAVYHRATFNADFGSRRAYVFFNLTTVYFCCVSLVGSSAVFYLAMGVWMLTDLCNLTPMPKEFWEKKA